VLHEFITLGGYILTCFYFPSIPDRKEGDRTEVKKKAAGGSLPQPIFSRRMRSGSHASAFFRLLTPGTGNRGPILAQGALYPGRTNRNGFCRGGRENRECRKNQDRRNLRPVDRGFVSHGHIRPPSSSSFFIGRRPGRARGFAIREVVCGGSGRHSNQGNIYPVIFGHSKIDYFDLIKTSIASGFICSLATRYSTTIRYSLKSCALMNLGLMP